MRATVSSARATCLLPSFSLAICTSIAHTISLRRLASTTARSTACFCASSALAFCETCSARALSEARRSSVFLLSSCSCTSGPSFFSISLTASVAAAESSFASREVSRMRWNSLVSCAPMERIASSSPLSVPTFSTDLTTSAVDALQLRRADRRTRCVPCAAFRSSPGFRAPATPAGSRPGDASAARRPGAVIFSATRCASFTCSSMRGDALLDLLEALGAILVAADLVAELVELLQREHRPSGRPVRATCWSAPASTCRRPSA